MTDLSGPSTLPDDLDPNSSDTFEALTCVICFSIFKEPKLLKCGHTFCYACIQELARVAHESHEGNGFAGPQFSCPECRVSTSATPSTVRSLPTNYRLAGRFSYILTFIDQQ